METNATYTYLPDLYTWEDQFFYHSDHLGSASWITDARGEAIQHLQYCPFGEPFVDEHSSTSTYSERFTFTGKERDEETGYSYFGARYLDATLLTSWFSVDRLSDKYPSLSPYNYCAWNPIKMIDPNGDSLIITGTKSDRESALYQMQYKSNKLSFSMDENGIVSYTINNPKKRLSKQENKMIEIIDSRSVTVKLHAQNTSKCEDGTTIDCGAFDGNKRKGSNDHVETSQIIDVKRSAYWDKFCNGLGNIVWHEITESYEGGLITLETGTEAQASFSNKNNAIKNQAHQRATVLFPTGRQYDWYDAPWGEQLPIVSPSSQTFQLPSKVRIYHRRYYND